MAWQRRVEDLQSYNRTIEVFVRSGPCCVSITVHLLITPSNPETWPSIVGYSSHDLNIESGGARLIPVVKPMWGLISLLDLTGREIGFKSVSDDDILFLAPASPRQTWEFNTSEWSGTDGYDVNDGPRPQDCSHYLSRVETRHSLSRLCGSPPRGCWLFTLSKHVDFKKEQPKHFCFVYRQGLSLLSSRAVDANNGSNKSTVSSLLATIPLIIADTWTDKKWYHNEFITVNGARDAGKILESLLLLWFIDFQWKLS